MIKNYSSNAILAKSRAMYAYRLKTEDYNSMLSCKSISEIANYLKNSTCYGGLLAETAAADIHRFPLENLLHRRLFTQYAKLCRYGFSMGADFYKFFIIQKDIEQILNCVRLLDSGNTEEYIIKTPVFLNPDTELDYIEFAKTKSFGGLLKLLENTEYKALLEPYKNNYEEKYAMMNIEADLINFKFRKLLELTGKSDVKNIFMLSCDFRAVINIYRLKRMIGTDKLLLGKMFIGGLSGFNKKQQTALIGAADNAEIKRILSSTRYGRQLYTEELNGLEDHSRAFLYKWHLKKLRYSTDPDTVMFCYLFLLENEISNIIRIIEGVRYGMPAEEIKTLINIC